MTWSAPATSSRYLSARVVYAGIEPDAIEVLARIARVVGGDEVRAHAETMFDTADRIGKRTAAVGKADAQFRQAFEHAAEYQAAGGTRLLGGHADEPRQPVLGHAFAAHHVPRVHEDRRAQVGGSLEERKQLRRVEIPHVHM